MDFEKNDLHIANEGGSYESEELNRVHSGNEYFHNDQERFSSSETSTNQELNDFSSEIKPKKKKEEKQDRKVSSASSGTSAAASTASAASAASAAAAIIPGVVVSLVGAVAVIGTSTGLINVPHSDHVSVFMSRSTELGFEVDRDENKTYAFYLYNAEYDHYEAVDFIDQVVFTDLIPNTVYELTCYDTSVDPNKLIYSGSYLTKSYDEYSSYITSSEMSDEYLNFDVEYEGENVDFVTVYVYGDNNELIYSYEGTPVEHFSVNVAGYTNVSCKISINGQITEFSHLISPSEIIHVESVSLDAEALELEVGKTKEVFATVLPENATNKELIWSSSDESVATVENGLITALKEGKTVISAKSKDGYKSASVEVSVTATPAVIHVESISLNKTELEMVTGDRENLSATVLPSDADDKSVTWTSSDESIATVSKSGKVSAISAGKVTITATTVDGGLTASCVINITAKVVPVTGVSLDEESVDFKVGETKQLTATVLPSSASNKGVTWSSTNEAVVTVSETGLLTAVSAGSAIVTVKTDDGGYQEYCIVSVSE